MRNLLIVFFLFVASLAQAQNFKAETEQHRIKYKEDFITNEHSPLKEADLKYLNFFDADSSYKVRAKVKLLSNEKPFKMPTYAGTTAEYVKYAVLSMQVHNQPVQLTLYKNVALSQNPVYRDYLFLPFTDQTNNKETYGGGRYMDLKTSDIVKDKIEIDFNKAYNPYCAYSDGYRCPIPPEENDLSLAIKAGEKKYSGEKKKRDLK
ncbi:DUF1684 domain-containing protein [Pedobacter sp.]|uniref:DUF1684 domain-containing protein n=1 Tax=Pedobacter sp. TaxID=1411316 RepID=UPI00396C780B